MNRRDDDFSNEPLRTLWDLALRPRTWQHCRFDTHSPSHNRGNFVASNACSSDPDPRWYRLTLRLGGSVLGVRIRVRDRGRVDADVESAMLPCCSRPLGKCLRDDDVSLERNQSIASSGFVKTRSLSRAADFLEILEEYYDTAKRATRLEC